MVNPFGAGEDRLLQVPPSVLVIFGATGDLTHQKLVPALFDLAQDGFLPQRFVVLGAARTRLSDQAFRDSLLAGVRANARRPITAEAWDRFAAQLFYQALDGTVAADFTVLKRRLAAFEQEHGERLNYLYYFQLQIL